MKMRIHKRRRNEAAKRVHLSRTGGRQALLERYDAVANDSDINVRPTIWKIGMPKNEIHAGENEMTDDR
jgi:hypothetical protein